MKSKTLAAAAFLLMAGRSGLARADDTSATAHEKAPEVTVTDADDVFTTNGTADIAAPRKTVFAVLLDYGHATTFIKSLNSSTISAHHGNQMTVVQEATGKAGIFSKDVHTVLAVTATPPSKITFVDTEKKDFYQYSGSWTLTRTGKVTTARYQLIAKIKGMSPEGITEGAFKENVGKMMSEVRTEAERRAAVARR